MRVKFFSHICFFMNPAVVLAATEPDLARPTTQTLSYSDVVNWSVSLMLVLAVFFLCAWAIRKSGHLSATHRGDLSILSGLSLGMREKIVLIKVGEKQLLLGVTPGRIDKLLELEGDDKLFQNQPQSESSEFANKLLQLMKGKSNE